MNLIQAQIKAGLAQGYSVRTIKLKLQQQGYSDELIGRSLRQIKQVELYHKQSFHKTFLEIAAGMVLLVAVVIMMVFTLTPYFV